MHSKQNPRKGFHTLKAQKGQRLTVERTYFAKVKCAIVSKTVLTMFTEALWPLTYNTLQYSQEIDGCKHVKEMFTRKRLNKYKKKKKKKYRSHITQELFKWSPYKHLCRAEIHHHYKYKLRKCLKLQVKHKGIFTNLTLFFPHCLPNVRYIRL